MLQVENLSLAKHEYAPGTTNFCMENISFELGDGYIMSLLGDNGAGKSTLLTMLYGMTCKKAGRVIWNGEEVNEKTRDRFRREVAFLGDDAWYYDTLTIEENIELLSILYPEFSREDMQEYLKQLGFCEPMNQNVTALSTGQRKVLGLAFMLARKPKLLLLDEPFANLDPVVRADMVRLLQKKVEENVSIMVSTHQLDEISEIADYVGLLKNGKLVAFGDTLSVMENAGVNSLEDLARGGYKEKQ